MALNHFRQRHFKAKHFATLGGWLGAVIDAIASWVPMLRRRRR